MEKFLKNMIKNLEKVDLPYTANIWYKRKHQDKYCTIVAFNNYNFEMITVNAKIVWYREV